MAIDLDKARAARREELGSGPVVIFGGQEHELSPELPFGVLDAMRGLTLGDDHAPGALHDVAKALLGEHFEAFLATHPSVEDLNELIGGVMEEYGVKAPLDSSGS